MHNIPHSNATKIKMSEVKKGKHLSVVSEFKKGGIPWNKGKHYTLSDEAKRNISHGLKGNKYAAGKIHSEDWKKTMSGKMKGNKYSIGSPANSGSFKKGQRTGENNHNWKGGVTPEHEKIRKSPEYVEWRKNVFRRDHFTCVNCGDKPRKIIADHIKPFFFFPELRLDINNGRTLCKECDKKIAFNYERDKHLYVKTA